MSFLHRQRIQFRIAHVMGVIVLLALALEWPVTILPATIILVTMAQQAKRITLAEALVICCIVGVLLGLLLPAVVTHHPTRNRPVGSPSSSPAQGPAARQAAGSASPGPP